MVPGQRKQKVSEAPVSTNKVGIVVHVCNIAMWEAYAGGAQSEADPVQNN
jgi:hypothetical protein